MPAYPTVDESRDRLHRAGWSAGEIAVGPPHAPVWEVDGTNGENRILAHGLTQESALREYLDGEGGGVEGALAAELVRRARDAENALDAYASRLRVVPGPGGPRPPRGAA